MCVFCLFMMYDDDDDDDDVPTGLQMATGRRGGGASQSSNRVELRSKVLLRGSLRNVARNCLRMISRS